MRGAEQTASPPGNCSGLAATLTGAMPGRSADYAQARLEAVRAPSPNCRWHGLCSREWNERTTHNHGSGNRITPAAASHAHAAGAAGAEAPPDVGDGIRSGDGAGAYEQSLPGRKPRRADTGAA